MCGTLPQNDLLSVPDLDFDNSGLTPVEKEEIGQSLGSMKEIFIPFLFDIHSFFLRKVGSEGKASGHRWLFSGPET